MPARVLWHDPGHIILYEMRDPLTVEDLEQAAEEVWALGAGLTSLIDMIFDYRGVTDFPRNAPKIVREGSFALPTLDRVALVGDDPLIEMMVITITHTTYRPNPTLHTDVDDAATYLRRMAQEDTNRG